MRKRVAVLVLAALPVPAAFAQATYQYTGRPFTYFSCGPSSDNKATQDCFNAPAPTNTLTSYTATDHVTATLSFSSALPPNLNYQDIKALPGFQLTMNDGHQTLVSGTPSAAGGVIAKVSTDGIGQLVGPWLLVINGLNPPNNGISSENLPPVLPFVQDLGTLACCDPTIHGDIGLNQNLAGTWTTANSTGLTYGTFTRVNQFDSYDHDDHINGGLEIPLTWGGAGSTLGSNVARADFKPITLMTTGGPITVSNGPSAGAWSDSNLGSGSGRGLSFATFTVGTSSPLTFQVNAVLHGQYGHDWFGLPDGTLAGGAQALVVDTDAFKAKVDASHLGLAAFLMGSGTAAGGIPPPVAFNNLRQALGTAVLGAGTALPLPEFTPFGVDLALPVTTTAVTVAGGKSFTVIFDVAAYSVIGGTIGWSAGTGTADFVRTLDPAPAMFTDANGNPVTGIAAAGSTPAAAPGPASILLAAAQPSLLAGSTAALTATVMGTDSHPLAGAFVSFAVTSGPNAGVTGGGLTDASGQATLTYAGNQGAGVDTVQATIKAISSNTVAEQWTLAPLLSGGSCDGTFNGTFHGNLTVSAGQNCVLSGAEITGDVTVAGGSLTLRNSRIGGNLKVEGGALTTGPVAGVGGNVEIHGMAAGSGPVRLCDTGVLGNVLVQNNASTVQIGSDASCPGNTITGGVETQNNAGPVAIFGNTIGENLQCQANGAVTGGGNTAGQKLGQCAAF